MPEIDPLREVISLCIMFGLNQAAITLINHLTEWFIKLLLIYNQAIINNKPTSNFDEYFSEGIKNYISKDMSQTISKAKSLGLLSKEEWKVLDKIREDYRNAFGHADSTKIFKDLEIKSSTSSHRNITSELQIIKIVNLPMVQGLLKVQFAEIHVVKYFEYIDNLIRGKLLKLLPSIKRMNSLT